MVRVPNTVSLEHLLGLDSITVELEDSPKMRALFAEFDRKPPAQPPTTKKPVDPK